MYLDWILFSDSTNVRTGCSTHISIFISIYSEICIFELHAGLIAKAMEIMSNQVWSISTTTVIILSPKMNGRYIIFVSREMQNGA